MITVIVPTYKPQDYFYECLTSIKNQDIETNYQVIIVLNGEKYPYYEAIMRFISSLGLTNCRLIYTAQKGVSNARNIALDLITEGSVAFIDDDDYISSSYLSSLQLSIGEDTSCISISNSATFTENNIPKEDYLAKKFQKKENRKSLFVCRSFFSVVWGKLIPLKVINSNRFSPKFSNGEDALFMAQISKNIKSIVYTDSSAVYCRRLRDNSASQSKKSLSSNFVNSLKLLKAYFLLHISSPFEYDFFFFISRYIAVFKVIFRKPF